MLAFRTQNLLYTPDKKEKKGSAMVGTNGKLAKPLSFNHETPTCCGDMKVKGQQGQGMQAGKGLCHRSRLLLCEIQLAINGVSSRPTHLESTGGW